MNLSTAGPPASAHHLIREWIPPSPQQAETRQRFLDLLRDNPEATRADHPGAHLTASAVVVNADRDRVLFCLHGRIGKWVQLGGHCEDVDDTLGDAALREATEESGIAGLRIDPTPINLDIRPVTCRYGPVLHYDVRFVVFAPPGAVTAISAEWRDLEWFAPNGLPAPLADAAERVVASAMTHVAGL